MTMVAYSSAGDMDSSILGTQDKTNQLHHVDPSKQFNVLDERFNTLPSFYTSLGFLLFFICTNLYYSNFPSDDPAMDELRIRLGYVGMAIASVSSFLSQHRKTWLQGHYLLMFGTCGLYLMFQYFTGMGLRNAIMPGTLVLLFYVSLVRHRDVLIRTYLCFIAFYVSLYVLEVEGYIPGLMLDKRNLAATFLMYTTLSTVTLLLCLSRYKKEKQIIEVLAEEKNATFKAKMSEQKAENLYKRQLEMTQTKQQFISFLAHEVKSPILAMKSGLELIREGAVDEATKTRIIEAFEKQIDNLIPVIGNVLEAGRLDSPTIRLNHDAFDLLDIVHSTVDTYRPLCDSKCIRIEVVSCIGNPNYYGDAVKLRQMVGNYISNALKYSQAQQIWIELHVREDGGAQAADLVEIRVCDDGIGIAKEKIPSLFAEYYQEEQAKRLNIGTGLGLSIVKKLAALMQGEVGAQTHADGRGSTFWFTALLARS